MRRILRKFQHHTTRREPNESDNSVDTGVDDIVFHLDSPLVGVIHDERVRISGWAFSRTQQISLRANIDGVDCRLEYGRKRPDVASAYPEISKDRTSLSGFSADVITKGGVLTIEIQDAEGWREQVKVPLEYSPELLVDDYYFSDLGRNMAEHQNLIEGKQRLFWEAEASHSYRHGKDDPRLVAFYLPQFHPIPENDRTWGKGFTEWTNVAAARPRFIGHQQPNLPADLGFYDLRLEQNIKAQIDLAKKHGIYGFCFYYYWFSGDRLLEQPLDAFLRSKEWDFNFMICWANENWSKRWDGRDNEVIIAQKYLKNDPLKFIKDVEGILLDSRYIRQDGKPMLAVYRGSLLDDPKRYIAIWRSYFKEKHDLDLHIITMLNLERSDPREYGFDMGVEFEPLTVSKIPDFGRGGFYGELPKGRLLDKNLSASVVDYRQVALESGPRNNFNFPTYKGVAPSWDNDARKKGKDSLIFSGANPDLYAHWLDTVLSNNMRPNDNLIFINAWNEWAEGAVLEPTQHFGSAVLNRTTEVLARHGLQEINRDNFPLYGIKKTADLAVAVHVFYENEWKYIRNKLKNLDGTPYDLFITLPEKNLHLIKSIKRYHQNATINVVPNRGRDILPFLFLLERLSKLEYNYVLKLHTKRSLHRPDGEEWFRELIDNLLPNKEIVGDILQDLKRGAAMIGPANHHISLGRYIGESDAYLRKYLAKFYGEKKALKIMEAKLKLGFFAGSMWWCRVDSLEKLISEHFILEDFESEQGQIEGTLAHAVERLSTLLPVLDGQALYESSATGVHRVKKIDNDYRFARRLSPKDRDA
jgi:lipopolysaccharide biosynthesis protein